MYKQHLENPNEFTNSLWGPLPNKLSNIAKYLVKTKNSYEHREDIINQLKTIIKNTHKQFGVYNSSIKSLLDNWDYHTHIIEIGHQPLYFGGSSFIINKISFAIGLAEFLNNLETSSLNATPVLFLGDHDQVQNELIISRFPQAQSYHGLEIKSNLFDKSTSTPMAYLQKPPEDLFVEHCNKIRSNYRELFKYSKIKGQYRPLLEERLESSLDLLYEAFLETNTFGDWIGKFWSKLFIIKNKSPLLIMKASDPELRYLLKHDIENLLKEDNRTDLIRIVNNKHKELTDKGYNPGLSIRKNDYSPIFYECQSCEFKNRIKLKIYKFSLKGKCSSCKTEISIQYDPHNPDLSDHYKFLSPRVETRSIIVNQLLDVSIRITGGGETSYHAQIIPYMMYKEINYPLIIKHPRIYYNTPWAEKTSSIINFDKLPTLHNPDSFKRMSKIAKTTDHDSLTILINENEKFLNNIFTILSEKENKYLETLHNTKNKQLQRKLDLIQLYLSHAYGKYEKQKLIQEVSWNWIDLGILTGINDLVGFYKRRIKPELPMDPTFWLSAGQYS